MQPQSRAAYWQIYEVLDALNVGETLPIATMRKMYAAVDELRNLGATSKHIAVAEKITVAMHRLEAAKRRANAKAEDKARSHLDGLVADWFEIPLENAAAVPKPSVNDNKASERAIRADTGASETFTEFQRGDGSPVVCQLSRVLFVARGDHGAVLHFGGGTQINLRNSFEEVMAAIGAA